MVTIHSLLRTNVKCCYFNQEVFHIFLQWYPKKSQDWEEVYEAINPCA